MAALPRLRDVQAGQFADLGQAAREAGHQPAPGGIVPEPSADDALAKADTELKAEITKALGPGRAARIFAGSQNPPKEAA